MQCKLGCVSTTHDDEIGGGGATEAGPDPVHEEEGDLVRSPHKPRAVPVIPCWKTMGWEGGRVPCGRELDATGTVRAPRAAPAGK
jgi:hypothetical protein